MTVSIQTIDLYEEDLRSHQFTFTVPESDIEGFRIASNRERHLLRVANSGGQRYMRLYRKYMEQALTKVTPPLRRGNYSRRELNYTLEAYEKALKEFNWSWAQTCDAKEFEEGRSKMQELKSVALGKGGHFKALWNAAVQSFQEQNKLQFG